MSVELRPYQVDLTDQTRALMQSGVMSILLQSPTGSGKTLLTAWMLKTAAGKRMTSWFVVHRRELVKQSIRAFDEVGVRHGVCAAGFVEHKRALIQLGSIQTLARRYKNYHPPSLIVWDEAHHVAAKSWRSIYEQFPNAFHVGLTATPERLDGKGLGKWFQRMINGPSVEWLIENKFLSPYRLYVPSTISTAGLPTRMGDYAVAALERTSDTPTITGDAIGEYKKRAAGKRAVAFCVSIQHSKHVVDMFNAAGIRAAHIDGDTDANERDRLLSLFAEQRLDLVSNVDLFGEGYDLPSLEVAILLRPTQSLGLYLQQVGRALRPNAGKAQAVILDHAGNSQRFGLPDDPRDWTLEDRATGLSGRPEAGIAFKVCRACLAAQRPSRGVCVYCGAAFEATPRVVEEVAGDLVEVDTEALKVARRHEQGSTQGYEALVELGRARGYKFPERWAHHVLKARQQRRMARGRLS